MKKFILHTIVFTCFAVIALESFFRWVIPASEYPYFVSDTTYQILKYDVQKAKSGLFAMGRLSELQVPWRLNNDGWNTAVDFQKRKTNTRIALFGDSYIENMYCASNAHIESFLDSMSTQKVDFYPFGTSGAAFSHFPRVYEYSIAKYNPDKYVIFIERTDLNESLFDVLPQPIIQQYAIDGDTIAATTQIQYKASKFDRILRQSALIRYIKYNFIMSLDPPVFLPLFQTEQKKESTIEKDYSPYKKMVLEVVTNKLLSKIPKEDVLFVFHPNIDAIQSKKNPVSIYPDFLMMQEYFRNQGIDYLDLTADFEKDYAVHNQRFDFTFNSHWNEYATRLVAQKLYVKLREKQWIDK